MAGPATTVWVSPDLSLAQIDTLVAQQEEVLGPLVSVGNDGKETLLTFDMLQEPPATHASIGIGSPPPDALATGKIFVAGELKDVFALRPV